MPAELSEPIEDRVQEYLINNIVPANVEGYDPTLSFSADAGALDDYLNVSTNMDDWGDYYPQIIVTDNDNDPVTPNGGETNFNSIQGDGSGPNQLYYLPITVSCQAVEGESYLNNTSPKQLAFQLAKEVHDLIQNAVSGIDDEYIWNSPTQPIHTRSNTEQNGDSTDTWHQYQLTVNVGVIDTP